MSFPLAHYREKIQAHFTHHQTTYALVGTYTVAAYAVHSRWGTVAVVVFTAFSVGVYTKAKSAMDAVWEPKILALFPVVTSVVAIFFPWLGLGLGLLTSGAHWWKERSRAQIVKKSEDAVQKLEVHNAQFGNVSAEMELLVSELQQECVNFLAIVQNIESSVAQHGHTQMVLASTDQKLSEQFTIIQEKIQQLFSMKQLTSISQEIKSENLQQKTQEMAAQTQNQVNRVDQQLQRLDNLTSKVDNLLNSMIAAKKP